MRAIAGAAFTQLSLGLDQPLPPDPLFELDYEYPQNKESIDNRIFRVYRSACRDLDQIPLTAELEMYEVGRVAIKRGVDDAALARVLRTYAESVRF